MFLLSFSSWLYFLAPLPQQRHGGFHHKHRDHPFTWCCYSLSCPCRTAPCGFSGKWTRWCLWEGSGSYERKWYNLKQRTWAHEGFSQAARILDERLPAWHWNYPCTTAIHAKRNSLSMLRPRELRSRRSGLSRYRVNLSVGMFFGSTSPDPTVWLLTLELWG